MGNLGRDHWTALKFLFTYLNGSTKIGLLYKKDKGKIRLEGYVDSNFAKDVEKRKYITSYMFNLSGCCVSWMSQLQPIVTFSSMKTEYIATLEAIKEAIWLQGLLKVLRMMKWKVIVFLDSQSTLHWCKNPVFHEKTKQVDVRFHLGECYRKGNKVDNVSSNDNPTDLGY